MYKRQGMEQHRLIKWLKFLVIFAAGCGMVMDLGVLPGVGSWMVDLAPEFGGYFWPWLIFLWILSVPCYMALWMAWKIFTDIEKDKALSLIHIYADAASFHGTGSIGRG